MDWIAPVIIVTVACSFISSLLVINFPGNFRGPPLIFFFFFCWWEFESGDFLLFLVRSCRLLCWLVRLVYL